MHTITRFQVDGVKYHWRGHTELVTDDGETLLATYNHAWVEAPGHKVGQLVITEDGKDLMDYVVVTSFIVQERADEHSLAVIDLIQEANCQAELAKERAEQWTIGAA